METFRECEAKRIATVKSILDYYHLPITLVSEGLHIPAHKLLMWYQGSASMSYDEFHYFLKQCNRYFLGKEMFF